MAAHTWLGVWNGAHRLYVDDRHKRLHFQETARQIIALVPGGRGHVLDYGPGDALCAEDIAAAAGRLTLCEVSELIRGELTDRYAGHPAIDVPDGGGLGPVPDRSVDLMVVNSTVQYLDVDELRRLLAHARRLLTPTGRLVVGDVIPRDAGVVADTVSLLGHARNEGFLAAAVVALVGTVLSPYTWTRMSLGLSRYDEREMMAELAAAGFVGRRHHPNLSHDRRRMTFVAERGTAHDGRRSGAPARRG